MFGTFFPVNSNKRKKKKAVDTNGYVQIVEGGSFFKDMDEAFRGSPTATMARLKFVEFCVPANLRDEYQKFWKRVVNNYIDYGYYLLHVSYTVDGVVEDVTYLNPKNYLVKDFDDNDNASTFKNIHNGSVFPAFNSNPAVVREQIRKLGFNKDFKGQIFMYNDTANPYRLTPLITVVDWMKTEANASTYVDKACENAMFGNNMFVIKKSSDSTPAGLQAVADLTDTLKGGKGAENTAQNFVLEWDGDISDIPNLVNKVSLSNEVDMDLLNGVDDKAADKICTACYGFPKILISQSEGIFGNSGEAISVATEQWSKTCQREAQNILDGLKEIKFNILKEVSEEVASEVKSEVDSTTLEAQAALKGSVGGVQALLAIQLGVSQGTTTYESGISMLDVIFGYDRDVSIKLLGDPKIETNGTIDNTDGAGA